MNLKHVLILAAVLICCSPNSKTEDNLIGNWNNSIAVEATTIDRNDLSNTIIFWDSIFYTKKIQINSNEIKLDYAIKYKIHDSLSRESKDTLNYIKSNDTLNISLKNNNNKSYYKYNIRNDSLIINYLFGDTVKYDSLTPLFFDKFIIE